MFFSKKFTSNPDPSESQMHLIEIQEADSDSRTRSKLHRDTQFTSTNNHIRRGNTWRSRFSGWRGGVLMAIIISSIALALNLVLAILAAVAWNPKNSIAMAFMGNCKTTGRWTIGLHLLINLLSSAILGASNFTMQRLAAPTRAEVDAAHAKRKSLDIGIPSVRNLFRISKKRSVLWLLLGLSSVPLHFVYNSVFFQTIAGNQVIMLFVIPEFFQEKDNWSFSQWGITMDGNTTDNGYAHYARFLPAVPHLQSLVLDGKYLDQSRFYNLTKAECMAHYGGPFITDVGAGFAVITPSWRESIGLNATETLALIQEGFGDFDLQNLDISYCLAEIVEQKCRIEVSLSILAVVIACGALKVVTMFIVLWKFDQEALVTIGDAIQSFISQPDPTTKGRCLMSSHDVHTLWKTTREQCPKQWQGASRYTWWKACSTRRWTFSLLFYISAIITASVVYRQSVRTVGIENGPIGQANIRWLINPDLPYPGSIIPPVLVANLPQVIASFLYLTYNGLFSCMLTGREWSQYSFKRAPLRVTRPKPGQRSTHFIQLPFTWGIPLTAASAILHWLISQTWFLVRVAMYQDGVQKSAAETINGNQDYGQYGKLDEMDGILTKLGYSNIALVTAICWLGALVCICVLVACIFKYPLGLPLGGTNSAVISASCQLRYDEGEGSVQEDNIAEKPVMWGVTIRGGEEEVGHCSFSTSEVERPKSGHLYA
ncbi:hypothetical protein BKA66DRAFT_466175 [Pyrenochaeta sp. MPI-SDFR-AT-0127]|nr:hypothetical protein BKA66DRAFT_466175 [Pyrenochaeta sp. MPI-SDFR-AT-0127]